MTNALARIGSSPHPVLTPSGFVVRVMTDA
jgi:hypothetical protein